MPAANQQSRIRRTDGEQNIALNHPIAFNGEGLNVDYSAHVSQQDVVYQSPPLIFSESMPIGDGDLGASIWCPGHLKMQINKSDLWADPPRIGTASLPGPAGNWQRISAGTLSLHSDAEMLTEPQDFEQILNLQSGLITIKADSPHGSCQITAFAAATAGVIVLNYQDQTLRSAPHWLEFTHQCDGHLFALGDTIGIFHAMRDRRCALAARIVGQESESVLRSKRVSALKLEPRRSSNFTAYIAAATCAKEQDPIRIVKSRLDNAAGQGYEKLLQDHRRHWSEFWQKSYLKITGPKNDSLPGYLENLWYLSLYQIAACSRSFDAPVPMGGLWEEQLLRKSPASLYVSKDLRNMIRPLLPANHLELTVPFTESYNRLIPILSNKNSRPHTGVRFPAIFNRHGDEFHDITERVGSTESSQESSIGDGIETALIFWEAWRYASDSVVLRERVYPLLKAVVDQTLDYARAHPDSFKKSVSYSKLSTLIHAAALSSEELEIDQDKSSTWIAAINHWSKELDFSSSDLICSLSNTAVDSALDAITGKLRSSRQKPQGFFYGQDNRPNIAISGEICDAISALMIREEVLLPADDPMFPARQGTLAFSNHRALKFFPVLPEGWSAAFSLLAPGGYQVFGEAHDGEPRYVAVKSTQGCPMRFFNPWGAGCPMKITEGANNIAESDSKVLQIETDRDKIYVLEKAAYPISRSVRTRYTSKPNRNLKIFQKDIVLGLKRDIGKE